jgi:hypothetical protein
MNTSGALIYMLIFIRDSEPDFTVLLRGYSKRLLHGIFHIGLILQTIYNVIVQIDIGWYLFETRLETKIFAS